MRSLSRAYFPVIYIFSYKHYEDEQISNHYFLHIVVFSFLVFLKEICDILIFFRQQRGL